MSYWHAGLLVCASNNLLGAVHNRRPNSRGRGWFVQCGHFTDKEGGVIQMRTSALFSAKIFGFF